MPRCSRKSKTRPAGKTGADSAHLTLHGNAQPGVSRSPGAAVLRQGVLWHGLSSRTRVVAQMPTRSVATCRNFDARCISGVITLKKLYASNVLAKSEKLVEWSKREIRRMERIGGWMT